MLPCSFDDIPLIQAQVHRCKPGREERTSSDRKCTASGRSALTRLLRVQHKKKYTYTDSRKQTPPEQNVGSKVHADLATARQSATYAVDVAGNAALSQHLLDLKSRVDALQQSAEVEAHSVCCHTIPTMMHRY